MCRRWHRRRSRASTIRGTSSARMETKLVQVMSGYYPTIVVESGKLSSALDSGLRSCGFTIHKLLGMAPGRGVLSRRITARSWPSHTRTKQQGSRKHAQRSAHWTRMLVHKISTSSIRLEWTAFRSISGSGMGTVVVLVGLSCFRMVCQR